MAQEFVLLEPIYIILQTPELFSYPYTLSPKGIR